ncbi:hypothetical protein HNP55_002241 [Paucibacter oligotrophus]|uniref:Uncharacterized protein n=1 Tax=Roseateles oligotrophus TaxID=1769250 RepID=A0A840LC08_9BURK|nr:hypothetical protein [Roseateles oligotrophus]MBB4843718.1 hypothetical protein [Roseateles oligotrophus]
MYSTSYFRFVRTLLLCTAWLPSYSMAQQPIAGVSLNQTQIMNARYVVLEGGRHLVEYGPLRWFLDNPSNSFNEVKRTETELFLMPVGGTAGAVPLVVDFAAGKTYMDFAKTNAWAAPAAVYPVSAYSVGRIALDLGQGARITLDVNGASNEGWVLTSYKRDGSVMDSGKLAANTVSRSIDNISFTAAGDTISVNPVARTCSVSGSTCFVRGVAPIGGQEVGHLKFGTLTKDNVWLDMRTLTQVTKTKWREESGTNSSDWYEVSRTPEYIELAPGGKNNIGNRFYLNPGSQVVGMNRKPLELRVAHVQRQWPGQLGTVFQPVSPGVSPGFQIQNKTDYPVLVTLEQIGCLYYGIVKPGEVFQRNTGAVWFTIKASMAPDLKEPTVASCIRKPALYAATIVVAGISTAGTAGMGTALVVPAMLATAAGQGAAIATQQYVLANNGTVNGARGARVGVATLTSGATSIGLLLASGGSLPTTLWPAITAMVQTSALGGATIGANELRTRVTAQSDIDGIMGQLTQEASVTGAYAGYPWPWPMADRVMPRYDITGGPRIKTLADGSTVLLTQERPLSINRVN